MRDLARLILPLSFALAILAPPVPAQAPERVSVFVEVAPGASRDAVRAFAATQGGVVRYEYAILPGVMNLRNIPATALTGLRNLPGVLRVSADPVLTSSLQDSTALIRGLQSQIQSAELSANGAGIRVCVIDSGIDSNHWMFQDWPDATQTRIDSSAARNFITPDTFPEDDAGHGAHVSGIAAGREGLVFNGLPLQGVAPKATIVPVKVLDASGSGQGSDLIAAFQHCTNPSLANGPAKVINVSLGYGPFTDRSTCDAEPVVQAANAAVSAGAVVVAAAGNDSSPNGLAAAGWGSNVLSVGATWDYSGFNFNDFFYCLSEATVDTHFCISDQSAMLDVVAPGCSIHSAAADLTATNSPNSVTAMCGTSMAAPHVSGLAALLLQQDSTLTPAAVRDCIRNGAVDLGASGRDPTYGYGRIDVMNSLSSCRPGGPTNQPPTARFTSSCSGLTCSFTSTSTDPDGSVVATAWTFGDGATGTGATASHTYTSGGSYTVGITVTDDDGATGTDSQTVSVASASIPSAPTNLNVQIVSTGTGRKTTYAAMVTWTDNATNEDSYLVQRFKLTGRKTQRSCTLDVTFTLSANTTGYTDAGTTTSTCKYAVAASNNAGTSAFVERAVTVP